MPHHNTVVKLLQVFLEVRPGPHRTATTTSPKVAEGSATSAKDSPAVDPFDCEPSWSRTHHSTRDAARKARHCRAEKALLRAATKILNARRCPLEQFSASGVGSPSKLRHKAEVGPIPRQWMRR
jgi:hypothetical protein